MPTMENIIKLSIVIPAFNEEKNLSSLIPEIEKNATAITDDYEIIVVNDGSTDDSLRILEELRQNNKKVKYISLARNFGQQAALCAGLDLGLGQCVITMDADWQHPPSLINELYKKYAQGADMVFGICNEQKFWNIKNIFSSFFYKFFKSITNFNIAPRANDFALLSRNVVDILKKLPEKDRFLRFLTQWTGLKKDFVDYKNNKRKTGRTKYSLGRSINLAVSGITSFSAAPLRASFWAGIIVSVFGFIYLCYVLFVYFFEPQKIISGWASIISMILILGGFQLTILGIIGEYIFKIYNEVKGRPFYIIKDKIGFDLLLHDSKYGMDNSKS